MNLKGSKGPLLLLIGALKPLLGQSMGDGSNYHHVVFPLTVALIENQTSLARDQSSLCWTGGKSPQSAVLPASSSLSSAVFSLALVGLGFLALTQVGGS